MKYTYLIAYHCTYYVNKEPGYGRTIMHFDEKLNDIERIFKAEDEIKKIGEYKYVFITNIVRLEGDDE